YRTSCRLYFDARTGIVAQDNADPHRHDQVCKLSAGRPNLISERTTVGRLCMSAIGPKQTRGCALHMSAFAQKSYSDYQATSLLRWPRQYCKEPKCRSQ